MKKNLEYKPIPFKDYRTAQRLLKQKQNLIFTDAFDNQIKELFLIKNHDYIGKPKIESFLTNDFKKHKKLNSNKYRFFYYPWNNHLVKIINKEEYLILKTNRNKNLITEKEQKILRNLRVAVFGMSVGSNIAFILTQTGISNSIIIADFDTLDTTNMNRIISGVHQIGLAKVIIAARKIYEDNPYAKVKIMSKGINDVNLETLLKNKQIDCIIEEIDDIKMKIKTRILAKKYKVPVIMVTDNGDGIVLHIERYDLGYNKIFNKDLSYWKSFTKKELTKEEIGKIIMVDIVGGINKVDPNMLKSVKRVINKELVSWPQLGSAALLGGVVATYAIKEIIKGNKEKYKVKYYNISI